MGVYFLSINQNKERKKKMNLGEKKETLYRAGKGLGVIFIFLGIVIAVFGYLFADEFGQLLCIAVGAVFGVVGGYELWKSNEVITIYENGLDVKLKKFTQKVEFSDIEQIKYQADILARRKNKIYYPYIYLKNGKYFKVNLYPTSQIKSLLESFLEEGFKYQADKFEY